MNHLIAAAIVISMQVLTWAPSLEIVEELETYEMLALVHMESTGDPEARRTESRYHGLLQISDLYMEDALDYANEPIQPASTLIGEGARSIQIFYWFMQRYSSMHNWEPEKVAVIHKTGPTEFQRILSRQRQGQTFDEAVCSSPMEGACEYLNRFRTYRSLYRDEWYSGQES